MHWTKGNITKNFHDELNYELNHEFDLSKPSMKTPARFQFEQVKAYLDLFGTKNVKIILFEDWIKNPSETINDIIKFLDLDFSFVSSNPKAFNSFEERKTKVSRPKGYWQKTILKNKTVKNLSHSLIPKDFKIKLKNKFLIDSSLKISSRPNIKISDREILINLFQSDVKKLKELLKLEFPWPNF